MGCCRSRAKPKAFSEKWRTSWPDASPIDADAGLDSAWIAQFPLRTSGRHVVNSMGERFRLIGINWYGASDGLHIVGGLDVQSLDIICATVRALGYTVVRLPFSNQMLRSGIPDDFIDYTLNPKLRGLSALEVFDEVIRCLGRHRVAVIVNNHTTYGEFCGPPGPNSLWFDPSGCLSEEQWLEDWAMVGTRYSRCPHVVGYDLRNEIRPRGRHIPYWKSSGSGDPKGACNWARAATAAAERLNRINQQGLIVVERLVWPQRGVQAYAASSGPLLPRFLGQVVLSVHMYHWSGSGRFLPKWAVPAWLHLLLRTFRLISARNYGDLNLEQLKATAMREWGCVLEASACPVWVSEFGADLKNPEEMQWLRIFVDVLAHFDADWAYWPLNVGPKPGTGTQGGIGDGDEAYGMLRQDWKPKAKGDERLDLLAKIGLKPLQSDLDALSFEEKPIVEQRCGQLCSAATENTSQEKSSSEMDDVIKPDIPGVPVELI